MMASASALNPTIIPKRMRQFSQILTSSNLSRSRCSSPSMHVAVVFGSHVNSAPANSFTHSA